MDIGRDKLTRENLTARIKAIKRRAKMMMESLNQAIEDLKFFKKHQTIQWIYSVDFSVIFKYSFPPIRQLFSSLALDTELLTKQTDERQKERVFYRNQIIELQGVIQHLIFNTGGRCFVILPPHQREKEHIQKIVYNALQNSLDAFFLRPMDENLIKLLNDDIVKKIVDKVAQGEKITEQDQQSIHHIIKEKYMLFKGLVSMSDVGGLNTMNAICGSDRLIKPLADEPAITPIMREADECELVEQSYHALWDHFARLRHDPRLSWNNHIDALALQWLNLINQRFLEQANQGQKPNKILIMISDATTMLEVARKSGSPKPLYNFGMTSLVRHPHTIFLLDKYREPNHPDGTINFFENMRHSAQEVVSNYSLDTLDDEVTEPLSLLSDLWSGMDKLLDVFGFTVNLKSFMDAVMRHQQEADSTTCKSQADEHTHLLADSLLAVIKFFDQKDNMTLLNKWKKNIEDELFKLLNKIEFGKGLVVVSKTSSFAHYVFRCQFNDLAIELDRDIFGPDQPYAFTKAQPSIDDLKSRQDALQKLRIAINKTNPHWEIFYLAAHVMEKSGSSQGSLASAYQYLEAHRLIKEGLNCGEKAVSLDERVECRKRFNFLKNIVLLREKKFNDAINSAKELCEEFVQTSPRFAIQLGYIYWRSFREKQRRGEGGEDDLKRSIEAAEMAWTVPEKTENQFKRCRLLISANLTSAYAYAGDLEKCSYWLEFMKELIPKEEDYGPINFHAIGSYYWLKVLKSGLGSTDKKTMIEIHRRLAQSMKAADVAYQKEDFADLIAKIQDQINLEERQKHI
jgi:hypothetical protein